MGVVASVAVASRSIFEVSVEHGATMKDLSAALATMLRAAWGSVVEQDDRPWLARRVLNRWCAGEATRDDLDDALRIAAEARAAAAAQVAAEAHRVDLAGAYYLSVGVHSALQVAAHPGVESDAWKELARRCCTCVQRCFELTGDSPEAAWHRMRDELRGALAAFVPAETDAPLP